MGLYFLGGSVTGQTYFEAIDDLRGTIDADPALLGIDDFMQDIAKTLPHKVSAWFVIDLSLIAQKTL